MSQFEKTMKGFEVASQKSTTSQQRGKSTTTMSTKEKKTGEPVNNEMQEMRNYLNAKGFSVGDDSSVSSTEIDFEKDNYMDHLREKLEPKRKRKDNSDSAKKAKNDD